MGVVGGWSCLSYYRAKELLVAFYASASTDTSAESSLFLGAHIINCAKIMTSLQCVSDALCTARSLRHHRLSVLQRGTGRGGRE